VSWFALDIKDIQMAVEVFLLTFSLVRALPMIKIRTIGTSLVLTLLFLMAVFPMTQALLQVKGMLFMIVVTLIVLSWLPTMRIHLHREVLAWSIFLILISGFFCLEGALAMTPGAAKQVQIYMFWPAMYTILLTGCFRESTLVWLHRVMFVSLLYISIYGLILVLTKLNVFPELSILNWLSFDEIEGIGFEEDYIGVKFQGLNSLVFLIPYMLSSLVLGLGLNKKNDVHSSSKLMLISFLLGLILVFISGRRALLLVLIFTFPIIIFLNHFNSANENNTYFRRLYFSL
jgi:hypothetical protein